MCKYFEISYQNLNLSIPVDTEIKVERESEKENVLNELKSANAKPYITRKQRRLKY